MLVEFRYGRQFPAHPEWKIQRLLEGLKGGVLGARIETSSAASFTIVRAFCLKTGTELDAWYETEHLNVTREMRMESREWAKCPDFEIVDRALDILLDGYEKT